MKLKLILLFTISFLLPISASAESVPAFIRDQREANKAAEEFEPINDIAVIQTSQTPRAIDKKIAAKVEVYLNELNSLQAKFTQIDAGGVTSGGDFYLKRPGKFRWEYDKRNPLLILSTGKRLVYVDKELDEVTYVDVKDTLAGFLARKNIKFSGDIELLEAFKKSGILRVTLRQKNKPQEGKLSLLFSEDPMEIVMMSVIDQDGYFTSLP